MYNADKADKSLREILSRYLLATKGGVHDTSTNKRSIVNRNPRNNMHDRHDDDQSRSGLN